MTSSYPTKTEHNFVCVAKVCVDFLKIPLIDILTNVIKPVDLYSEISKSTLSPITGTKKLNRDQSKICFISPPDEPDYNLFDVTLLYTLLRNLCPSLRPTWGWGSEPKTTDKLIGDDIERLRCFRNKHAHANSTEITDDEFDDLWKNLKYVIQRCQTFTKSNTNYEQKLTDIESLRFGYGDLEKYKLLLQATILTARENPEILITGAEEVTCGETARFEADVKQAEPSSWSVAWQKVHGRKTTEEIDTGSEKYKGSSNRRLVINTVGKEDEGEYQAVLSRELNRRIFSNLIYLHPVGDKPYFDDWNETTGREGINIHYSYGVTEKSPKVHRIWWTKDGEELDHVTKKYCGGGLNDSVFTLTSPSNKDRGTYLCTVTNAVGSVSKHFKFDIPKANIEVDPKVYFGSKIVITPKVLQSCPLPDGVKWQKSIDGDTFQELDIGETKYYGSSIDPHCPKLVIRKTTFEDTLYYRLQVWNKIGESFSNTSFIKVTGEPPNVLTSHEIYIKNRAVRLIGKVFVNDWSPEIQNIKWTKDGQDIDSEEEENAKYSKENGSSLTINKVNHNDAGSYQLTATNAVGSSRSQIVLGLPRINWEKRKTTDYGLSWCYTAKIESIPAPYQAQWKVKNKDDNIFTPIDVNAEEYKGSSNSLPRPVLVIRQTELENQFHLEVNNFVGSTIKEINDDVQLEIPDPYHDSDLTCDISSNIINKNGSTIRFNDLRRKLVKNLKETDLQELKDSLEVLTSERTLIRDVNSIGDFFRYLLDEGVLKERNVIILQYLLKSIDRPDLEQMCVQYATRDKQALCYYGDPNSTDGPKAYLHVMDDIEKFTKMESLLKTVASIVDCTSNDIKVVGVKEDKSFIIIITMREELINILKETHPLTFTILLQYNVDWIRIGDMVVNIVTGTYQSRLMGLKHRKDQRSYVNKAKMEPPEETDDAVERRYNELCLDLNMDKGTKEEAWESYQKIKAKYTLEGDQMHWLACALFEACRKSVTPTVGRGTMEVNGVSLTRLLRSAKFSLIQFFNKMMKWSDLAGLPQEFIDKVNKLEKNFAVSTMIFKKFEPIFSDIFKHPTDSHKNKQNRNKKQRRMPCTSTEVFNFCWTMFIQVKGHFPAIGDVLVNSYHILICCLDWFYANALMGGRKDLLNPSFEGLPEDFGNRDWKPPTKSPCLIKYLCDKHEGLEIEAKVIKEHWWKPHIKKLFDKKILKGKPDTLSAVLEVGNFDANNKSMNSEYEAYVLSVGDFDERVFLGSEADEETGTPTKYRDEGTGELAERLQMRANLQQHIDETNSLAPSSPLTGRRYLKDKDPSTTPISTATQSVSKLQTLLLGRKSVPSDDLLDILSEIGTDPKTRVMEGVTEMGEIFCALYVKKTDDHAGSQIDFAKKRLQLGECLYYKLLESILVTEKKRNDSKEGKAALATLMEQDIFHRTLFACCLEIVMFSYNSQRSFPWIVEIFNLSPYHFYKVIEIIIRTEEGFSRDVVKHLNHIEESILESLAWKSESPLWDAIKESSVPGSENVVLPNEQDVMKTTVKHPAVIRVTETQPQQQQQQQRKDVLMSPPAGVSAVDRFSSPSPGSAKRRFFSVLTQPTETPVSSAENSSTEGSSSSTKTTQIIAFQQAQTNDGRQILIPAHTIIHSGAKDDKKETTKARPKKTGSLALFFRKLYHLASVRLRDLCEQLYIDDVDLRKKMWTCFEYVLVNHVELMMDRHIDQIIMCAIYVMAKVCDHSQSFTDIMRCYKLQPQAESHVYRSVLLKCRTKQKSGGSDSSKNDTSGQSSVVNVENVEKKRSEKLSSMHSTSTLPTPHPGSHPPTPTIFVHSATGSKEGEERGDLIMFYNRVFVEKVKKFAPKFSAQKNAETLADFLNSAGPKLLRRSMMENALYFGDLGCRRGRKRKAEMMADIAMAEDLSKRNTATAVASVEPESRVPLINLEDCSRLSGDEAPLKRDLDKWLDEHPGYMVDRPPEMYPLEDEELLESGDRRRGRRPKVDPAMLDPMKRTGEENVSVVNRVTSKRITGAKAPTNKYLSEWLEQNPLYDKDPNWTDIVKSKANLPKSFSSRVSTPSSERRRGRPWERDLSSSLFSDNPYSAASLAASMSAFPGSGLMSDFGKMQMGMPPFARKDKSPGSSKESSKSKSPSSSQTPLPSFPMFYTPFSFHPLLSAQAAGGLNFSLPTSLPSSFTTLALPGLVNGQGDSDLEEGEIKRYSQGEHNEQEIAQDLSVRRKEAHSHHRKRKSYEASHSAVTKSSRDEDQSACLDLSIKSKPRESPKASEVSSRSHSASESPKDSSKTKNKIQGSFKLDKILDTLKDKVNKMEDKPVKKERDKDKESKLNSILMKIAKEKDVDVNTLNTMDTAEASHLKCSEASDLSSERKESESSKEEVDTAEKDEDQS